MALKYGLTEWQQYQLRNDENVPIVLCFGNSWFWYPNHGVGNLANRFLDFGRHLAIDVAAVGKNGMEIAHPGKCILSDLTTFLQWEGKTVDLIAVSGGGNDFAGAGDLYPLLKTGKSNCAENWFRTGEEPTRCSIPSGMALSA